MKKLGLISLMAFAIAACSSPSQEDHYLDASFELCNTEVKSFSMNDDNKVRIACADGSAFSLDNPKTLETMQDLNATYCSSQGLGKFNESRDYYSFRCKSGEAIRINK